MMLAGQCASSFHHLLSPPQFSSCFHTGTHSCCGRTHKGTCLTAGSLVILTMYCTIKGPKRLGEREIDEARSERMRQAVTSAGKDFHAVQGVQARSSSCGSRSDRNLPTCCNTSQTVGGSATETVCIQWFRGSETEAGTHHAPDPIHTLLS
eukprot:749343-Hanusia_phi.AAC.2